jgi:2-oxoisovalerate dehydrogenase E1 component alpha subunit
LTLDRRLVAHFEIFYTQFLNPEGQLTQPLPEAIANKPALWQHLYKFMVLSRVFDTKAINLQRTGQMGTFPPSNGHEGINIGMGAALQAEDIFVPYYREAGTSLMRGVRMEEILMYWGGDERGSDYQDQPHDFPPCVPIATQSLIAAGVASAVKYKKEKRAVLTTIGDGGTSKGDFYEGMNVAGVWQLPVVFVIANNHWAISVPSSKQTHAQTFAQKAIAAGISSEQVDGCDVFAVYHAVSEALTRARAGKGPHVIEAICTRMGDHTTADDASRYRSADELVKGKQEDPIKRLKLFMESQGAWDESQEQALQTSIQQDIDSAVDTYLKTIPQPATAMFDYLYESLPDAYHDQRDELIAYFGGQS